MGKCIFPIGKVVLMALEFFSFLLVVSAMEQSMGRSGYYFKFVIISSSKGVIRYPTAKCIVY